MAQESRNQIMDKLKKLMNHYEGAKEIGSEEEANVAALMLQQMLIKYNISSHELNEARGEDTKAQEIIYENMSWYTHRSIGGEWEFRLMDVICRWNLCRCFYLGSKKYRKMVILGERQNIEFVKWLHQVLAERYVNISKIKYGELRNANGLSIMKRDTFQRHFLLGCCDGLNYKFQEIDSLRRTKDSAFDGQCTALVLLNDENLNDWVKKNWGKTGRIGGGRKLHGVGYGDGVRQGYTTEINKPIATDGDRTKMIG